MEPYQANVVMGQYAFYWKRCSSFYATIGDSVRIIKGILYWLSFNAGTIEITLSTSSSLLIRDRI
jgi:hypothetical protein